MSKTIRETLVRSLATGGFVSGQALGKQLGVSRTAIAKHIDALTGMGLDIFRVQGKGYKLAKPLVLLSKDAINTFLASRKTQTKSIEVHSIIDSTNSYLMRRISSQISQGEVCVAEYQSAGRGRRGRQWQSPFGSHLYLSMYWRLEQGIAAAMGLSLVTALAVSDAIKQLYGLSVQLKWPNDIYLTNRKLAGILIELEGQTSGPSHSIIGIGLNLNMPAKSAEVIDQPWTDLQSHTRIMIDRNQLSAVLIDCLQQRLSLYQEQGLGTMVTQWHNQDIYLNKKVRLVTGDRQIEGLCRGINNQGALLLEVSGKVKTIYGGEVSLRGEL